MKKGVLFLIALLTLQGCSTMGVVDAINPLKEDKGIDVTAQVGKENTSNKSKQLLKVDTKTDYTGSVIGSVDYSTNFPWWALVLSFMVGILVRPIDFIKDWRNMNE